MPRCRRRPGFRVVGASQMRNNSLRIGVPRCDQHDPRGLTDRTPQGNDLRVAYRDTVDATGAFDGGSPRVMARPQQ